MAKNQTFGGGGGDDLRVSYYFKRVEGREWMFLQFEKI